MQKTVVELDLVGYSTIGDNLEQGLDVNSVAQLNDQIQSFVDLGLQAIGAHRARTVMATTGDGAILVLDAAPDAHRFAQAVHEATQQHNQTRPHPLTKRVFRSGAATGDIFMQPKPAGGFDIAGTTIARAVRLEAKATPGGLLLDEATFTPLAADQKRPYGPKQTIAGKRDELFAAYHCQLNADGPKDVAYFTQQTKTANPQEPVGRDKRRQVLAQFKRLKSHQYFELIFLLEMPIGQRPPDVLNLDQRKEQILKWADENAHLDDLLEVILKLVKPPGPDVNPS